MRKLNKRDYELCDKITTRAIEMGFYPKDRRITCMMDVQNAAMYYNIRLEEWLNSDKLDFAHDIVGIMRAINRITPIDFSNDPMFLPRFAGDQTND